jgi:lysophospholipase L1-like esterase
LLAVLVGLAPLVALELALRIAGVGRPTDYNDPFVGFSEIQPLFVLNEAAERYEIPKSRQTHFCPESFAATKGANEFRIFVLGGSTVQGRPFEIDTAFPAWLELNLQAADSSKDWEVVNCGGVSYATYRLAPILQEVLHYQPDLVIFCEGHNEFLEDRSYGEIKTAPPMLAWPQRQVMRLRTYNVLRGLVLRMRTASDGVDGNSRSESPKLTQLGPEADAILDWRGGMAKYRRDPAWQADVERHFEFNLRRIVELANSADVPLLFVAPVSNLEWPPFKPQHRGDISDLDKQRFEDLMRDAADAFGDDPARALTRFRQAAVIDEQHAQVHFEMGLCLRELGRWSESQAALTRAKDLDVCPLRMLEPLERILHRVARETGTPLVDADALFAAHSRSGYPDNQWLVDHVHPSVEGHQLWAEHLLAEIERLGFVQPVAGWEAERDAAYEQHLAALHPAYFERGQRRLRAEQRWAHGQTRRQRPETAHHSKP